MALGAVAVLLLEAAADFLPDSPTLGYLNPVRAVILLGLAAAAVSAWAAAGVRAWRVFGTWLDPFVLLTMTGGALAAAGSGGWGAWRWQVSAVAVYYLVVAVARVAPQAVLLVPSLATVGVALAAVPAVRDAMAQVPTGHCRSSWLSDSYGCAGDAVHRAQGTFANPNLLAAFLVMLLPFVWVRAVDAADAAGRWVARGVLVLGVLALVATYSRGGVLALAGAALAFWVLSRPSRARVGVAVALSGAALLIGGMALALGGNGQRRELWAAAVSVARRHPLGVGPGRAGEVIGAELGQQVAHAHNLWLGWLVEGGVVALFGMAGLTAMALAVVWTAATRGVPYAAATGAAVVAVVISSVVDTPTNAARLAMLAAVVFGLAMGRSRLRRQGDLGRHGQDAPATTLSTSAP